MGRLPEAEKLYKETMTRFPYNDVIRRGYANLLLLQGQFSEVRALLKVDIPSRAGDFISFHILAMCDLKEGEIDPAIRRLEYGVKNSRILKQRSYFISALGLAWLRRKDFLEAARLLKDNIVDFTNFQKPNCLILLSHAQAAAGQTKEAASTLAELETVKSHRIIQLKECLTRCYSLTERVDPISKTEKARLELEIEENEFILNLRAA